MEEVNCPVEHCEDCEFHRTESWCAKAIPLNKTVYDDKYRSYMEGFWEALDWAEEHYKWLQDNYEKNNDYLVLFENILNDCYASGRAPTAEEMMQVDNFWNNIGED